MNNSGYRKKIWEKGVRSSHLLSFFTLMALLVFFTSCGGLQPGGGTSLPDLSREESVLQKYWKGPATALSSQAKHSLSMGEYGHAELLMERALRIEPANPALWYYMGKVKFKQNNHYQAVQFCLKSKSLGGRDRELIWINDSLIHRAREKGQE